MGIKNLNKNLEVTNFIYSFDNEQAYLIFNGEVIRDCNLHIDFSDMINRIVFKTLDIKQVINFVKRFISDIQKENKLYLYIDPKKIERKFKTRNDRKTHKEKMLLCYKNKIKNEYFETINDEKIKKEDLLEKINKFNNSYEDFKNGLIIFESIKSSEELNKYYYQSQNMNYIKQMIFEEIEHLLIVDRIYYSKIDAELDIIRNITKNKITKNIIFGVDQDIILFSFLFLKTNYIYIKNSLSTSALDIKIYKNNYLMKNISILTLFCNKSDYFYHNERFPLTPKKVEKIIITNKDIFNKNYIKVEYLIRKYLSLISYDKKNKPNIDNKKNDMYLFILEMNKYLLLKENFFVFELEINNKFDIMDWIVFFNL